MKIKYAANEISPISWDKYNLGWNSLENRNFKSKIMAFTTEILEFGCFYAITVQFFLLLASITEKVEFYNPPHTPTTKRLFLSDKLCN